MNLNRRTELFCGAVVREVARLRKEAGLSQNQLAPPSGLNQSTINLLEAGKTTPTVASLYRLADALGVSPAKILESALAELPALEKQIAKYVPPATEPVGCVAEDGVSRPKSAPKSTARKKPKRVK